MEIIDEVLHQLEKPENPYSTYRVEYPFICSFTIPEDDHNTEITIETVSDTLMNSTSKQDIRLHLKKDQEIGGPMDANRILKWVQNKLWNIHPRDVSVEYGDNPIIEPVSKERMNEIIGNCLNEE